MQAALDCLSLIFKMDQLFHSRTWQLEAIIKIINRYTKTLQPPQVFIDLT